MREELKRVQLSPLKKFQGNFHNNAFIGNIGGIEIDLVKEPRPLTMFAAVPETNNLFKPFSSQSDLERLP